MFLLHCSGETITWDILDKIWDSKIHMDLSGDSSLDIQHTRSEYQRDLLVMRLIIEITHPSLKQINLASKLMFGL